MILKELSKLKILFEDGILDFVCVMIINDSVLLTEEKDITDSYIEYLKNEEYENVILEIKKLSDINKVFDFSLKTIEENYVADIDENHYLINYKDVVI